MYDHIAARRNVLSAITSFAIVALLPIAVPAQQQDVETIEHKLQQYAAWFNQGDADAVSRLYSTDVVYYGPLGRVFEGRSAVEQHYENNLAAGFSDMTIEAIEVKILGDTAYDIARYTIVAPNGVSLAGYHLGILEKEDGEWLVRRTLVNAVMPQPPTE